MDEALSPEQHATLVEEIKKEKCPRKRLEITAIISRQLYDAEKAQLSFFRGASILDPVFKGLEIERERRRYQRQKETIEAMANELSFRDNLDFVQFHGFLADARQEILSKVVFQPLSIPSDFSKQHVPL